MKILFKANIFLMLILYSFGSFSQVLLPPVNLGSTSFVDGMGGPGTLIEESFVGYSSNKIADNQGNSITQRSRLESFSAVTLIAHITHKKIFGAYYGFEVLLPTAKVSVDVFEKNTENGVGDASISPLILQWVNGELFNLPFNHRLNFSFIVPTGSYDDNRQLNIGNNALSFNPHYAFTLNLSDHSELSMRAHYLWNGKNNSPNKDENLRDTQAGQAFHLNVSSSYQINNQLKVGLSGYYLKQLNQHEANGDVISDSLEQVFAVGPGLQYKSSLLTLHANSYFESFAKNRPEGKRYIFKISKVF
jgi:hypothetical protein